MHCLRWHWSAKHWDLALGLSVELRKVLKWLLVILFRVVLPIMILEFRQEMKFSVLMGWMWWVLKWFGIWDSFSNRIIYVQVNASHHRVVQLMGEAALRGQVTMILRRKTPLKHKIYPYDVIVSRNENEGFGFVIISSTSQYYGSTIGE